MVFVPSFVPILYVDINGLHLPFVLLDNSLQLHFDIGHLRLLIETSGPMLLLTSVISIHFMAPAIKFNTTKKLMISIF